MNIIALIFSLLMLANSTAPLRSEPTAPPYDLGHGLVYGVDYAECDAETEARVRERWDIERRNEEPDPTKAIYAFDVSESGRTAIATADQYILVYDNRQNFEYALKFSDSGDYGVLWADEYVVLLTVRSDNAYVMSEDGELLYIFEMLVDDGDYWGKIVKADERIVSGVRYHVNERISTTTEEEFPRFRSGYKYLISVDSHGNETCLYEATENLTAYERFVYKFDFKLFAYGSVVLVLWLVACAIVRIVKKKLETPTTAPPPENGQVVHQPSSFQKINR